MLNSFEILTRFARFVDPIELESCISLQCSYLNLIAILLLVETNQIVCVFGCFDFIFVWLATGGKYLSLNNCLFLTKYFIVFFLNSKFCEDLRSIIETTP